MTSKKTIHVLDDIIRENRDRCSIRVASNSELMKSLPPMVSLMKGAKPIKAVLDDYHAIYITLDDKCQYFLIGKYHDRGGLVMTSALASVDFVSNLALTRNSLYQLGSPGNDEPDIKVLMHICATLRSWGLRGFGIPEILY